MVRPDKTGTHRTTYEKNRKRILASQNTCGICGHPVNFNLKSPDPMSPVVDHIVPVSKGGHPSDIDNLQLAHHSCNRAKSDKLFNPNGIKNKEKIVIGNRNLPQSTDWTQFRPK